MKLSARGSNKNSPQPTKREDPGGIEILDQSPPRQQHEQQYENPDKMETPSRRKIIKQQKQIQKPDVDYVKAVQSAARMHDSDKSKAKIKSSYLQKLPSPKAQVKIKDKSNIQANQLDNKAKKLLNVNTPTLNSQQADSSSQFIHGSFTDNNNLLSKQLHMIQQKAESGPNPAQEFNINLNIQQDGGLQSLGSDAPMVDNLGGNPVTKSPDVMIIQNLNDVSELNHRFGDQEERQMNEKAGLKFLAELLRFQQEQDLMNDEYFAIVEKDSLEKIDDIKGRCSMLLRCVRTIMTQISRFALFVITTKVFETCSILVIIGNSLSLAVQNPLVLKQPVLYTYFDYFFQGYYTMEMILKICAFGFIINKGSYIRDPWNILDFTIITTGFVTIFPTGSNVNLSVLRVFRVLRPLRTISSIQGLKVIMDALIAAMPLMRDTFVVLFFYYFILAIIGMELFTGLLKKQCVHIETTQIWGLATESIQSSEFCGQLDCSPGYICAKTNQNPNFESYNFDTIFYSLLASFQSSTGEGWTNNMEDMQEAYNLFGAEIYFQFDNLAGNFFLLNIFAAVICATFSDEHDKREQLGGQQVKKKKKKKIDYEDLDDEERMKFIQEQEQIRLTVMKKWRVILYIKRKMRLLLFHFRRKRDLAEQTRYNEELEKQTSLDKRKDQLYSTNPLALIEEEFQRQNSEQTLGDDGGPPQSLFHSRKTLVQQTGIEQEEEYSRTQFQKSPDDAAPQNHMSKYKFHGISHDLQKSSMFQRSGFRKTSSGIPDSNSNSDQLYQKQQRTQNASSIKHESLRMKPILHKHKKKANPQHPYHSIKEQFEDFLNLELNAIVQRYDDDQLDQIKQSIEQVDKDVRGGDPNTLSPVAKSARKNQYKDDDHDSLSIDLGSDYRMSDHHPINELSFISKIENGEGQEAQSPAEEQQFPSSDGKPARKLKLVSDDSSTCGDQTKKIILKGGLKNSSSDELQQLEPDDPILDEINKSLNMYQKSITHPQIIDQDDLRDTPLNKKLTDIGHLDMNDLGDNNQYQQNLEKANKADSSGKGIEKQQFDSNQSNYKSAKSSNSLFKKTTACPSVYVSLQNTRGGAKTLKSIKNKKQEEVLFNPDEILNSRMVVQPEIGMTKKIYLLPDKFEFKSQDDVFEGRKRATISKTDTEQPEIVVEKEEEEINPHILREEELNVKPYMKKIILQFKKRHIDATTLDLLQSYMMDEYDYANLIQEKYDTPYISNYIVTGTISMVLENNIQAKMNRRKTKSDFKSVEDSLNSKNSFASQPSVMKANSSKRNTFSMSKSHIKNNTSNAYDSSNYDSPTKKFHDFHKTLLYRTINELENGQQFGAQTEKKPQNQSKSSMVSATMRPHYSGVHNQRSRTSNQFQSSMSLHVAGSKRFVNKQSKFKDPTKDINKFNRILIKRMSHCLYQSNIFKYAKNIIPKKEDIKFMDHNDDLTKKRSGDSDEEDDDEEYTFERAEDEYVDFKIDNMWHINHAIIEGKASKKNFYEWSGQDVLEDYDPTVASQAIEDMNMIRVWPQNLHGHYKRLRAFFKEFIRNLIFEHFLTLCVLCNTVLLAYDNYGLDINTQNALAFGNEFFTYIFVIEMGFKLIGIGPYKYMQDKMNYLDGSVVTISLIEIGLDSQSGSGGNKGAFTAIRTIRIFRVLRIARILRTFKSMRSILFALVSAMNEFVYLAGLLFLFIFIYVLLGMQLFGGRFFWDDDGDGMPETPPRQNFDNFLEAFYVVFQVLTDENWFAPLYWTMRGGGPWVGALYCVSWLIIGSYTILNLFTAILVDAFMGDDEEDTDREKTPAEIEKELLKYKLDQELKKGEDLIILLQKDRVITDQKMGPKTSKKRAQKINLNILDESFEIDQEMIQSKKVDIVPPKPLFEGNECINSLYIFNQKHKFRIFMWQLSNHNYLEYSVMIVIVLSTLKLVLDTYLDRITISPFIDSLSNGIDLFFTSFFCAECAVKVVAMGFIQDRGTYIRDNWSKLDFFIVITSFIDAVSTTINIPALKILRLLRTLRPLRFLSHNSSMKILFVALVNTFSNLGSITSVIMIVWLVFCIVGMNLFGGKMYFCNFGPPMGVMNMWMSYKYLDDQSCLQAHGNWLVQDYNFDNLGWGFLDLFDVCSQENWPDTMNECADLTGENSGPVWDNSNYYGIFYVAFVFISNFMFINLFMGFLEKHFDDSQQECLQEQALNEKQNYWLNMISQILGSSPDIETISVPKVEWRKRIHKFITYAEEGKSNNFDLFILAIIILNILQMSSNYETSSVEYGNALTYLNYIFTFIFLIELILKFIAFGRNFSHSTWNMFDLVVVTASVVDIVMSPFISAQFSIIRIIPQLARVLRVFRLFKIFKRFEGIQSLITTIYLTIPYITNAVALVFLIYFIFSILCCYLFSNITQGQIINVYFNFSTFGFALSFLMKSATGEDWNHSMMDTMRNGPDCIPLVTCGWPYSYFIFVPFMILTLFVMENVFQIVTNNAFDIYYMGDNNVLKRFKADSTLFKKKWTEYTREYDCLKMKGARLLEFFQSMPEPLGMAEKKPNDIMKEILKMQIEADDDGFVYFNELLYKSMKRIYGERSVRNMIVAQTELHAQQKIYKLRLATMQRERSLLKVQDANVNPFLLMMYVRMSFTAWMQYVIKHHKQRKEYDPVNIPEGVQKDDSHDHHHDENNSESEEEDKVSEYIYVTDREVSCYSSSDEYEDYDDELEGEQLDIEKEQNNMNIVDPMDDPSSNRQLIFQKQQSKTPFMSQDMGDRKLQGTILNRVYSTTQRFDQVVPTEMNREQQLTQFRGLDSELEEQHKKPQAVSGRGLNIIVPEPPSDKLVQKIIIRKDTH